MNKFLNKLEDNFLTYKDKKAVKQSDGSFYTYDQVDKMSSQIHAKLLEENLPKNSVVIVNIKRGIKIIPSIIGIWKAGLACVVCESTMPQERVDFIIKDTKCKVIIDDNFLNSLPNLKNRLAWTITDEHDWAYLVYTSGTTGNPKGVIHEFGNFQETIDAKQYDGIRICRHCDVLAINSPLNFIASMDYIINMLYCAGTILIVDISVVKNPPSLIELYEKEHITSTFMTPSLFKTLSRLNSQMEWIILGGEPCSRIYDKNIALYNGYNLSEAGRDIFLFKIDKKYDLTPVGKHRGPEDIVLLNEEGQAITDGNIGEICFKNEYVAGYINLAEESSFKWKDGIFHTGDLAKKDSCGNIVLLGRNDDMIKINGNRIEPTEIEAAIKNTFPVNEVCVKGFVRQLQSFVVAYYVADEEIDFNEKSKQLANKLPSYMIPSYFIKIDSIPILPNGKIDKKHFKAPNLEAMRADYCKPTNDIEKLVCTSFEKVLNLDKIGLNDNFYILGGNSILTAKLVSLLDNPALNSSTIYNNRTPKTIAKFLKEHSQTEFKRTAFELSARKKTFPITKFQEFWLDYQLYSPFSNMLNMYTFLLLEKSVDVEQLKGAIVNVINNYPIFKTTIYLDKDNNFKQRFNSDIQINTNRIEHIKISELDFNQDYHKLLPKYKLIEDTMYKFLIISTEKNTYLLFDIHHVLADGTSILNTLEAVIRQYNNKKLPFDYYYSYLDNINNIDPSLQEEAKSYFSQYKKQKWICQIPYEYKQNKNKLYVDTIKLGLNIKEFNKILADKSITVNEYMLSIGLLLLRIYTRQNNIMCAWTYNGRDNTLLMKSIGMFINNLPVAIRFNEINNLAELFASIKNQINNGIKYCFYPYLFEEHAVSKLDPFCVQNQIDIRVQIANNYPIKRSLFAPLHEQNSCYLLLLQIVRKDNQLELILSGNGSLYDNKILSRVKNIISNVSQKLLESDFDSQQHFNKLIYSKSN